MAFVATVKFHEARQCVIEKVMAARQPRSEETSLEESAWRVLAEDITADRDFPPVARSLRDGYAVRSAELPGSFGVIGEVRAGESFKGDVGAGQAIEIMTGAPMPAGADQVVMIEYTQFNDGRMTTSRPANPGEWINPQGAEARRGDVLLKAGRWLDYGNVALMAAVGKARPRVYRKPRVAIIPTGDEIVEVADSPLDYQVRNSNAYSLAVQVRRAGGIPEVLPVAIDEYKSTREVIERGLGSDLMLLSGGVSAGKYDIVEDVLAELGAEFYFDRTLIQPGRPTVFGQVRDTLLLRIAR